MHNLPSGLATLATAVIIILSLAHVVAIPIAPVTKLYCGPASWETVFAFYILNYGAHAITIKPSPGDRTFRTIVLALAALLVPFSGVLRGCGSIARAKVIGESDTKHALRAGALCMLVRTVGWKPNPGDKIEGCKISGSLNASTPTRIPLENIIIRPRRHELRDDLDLTTSVSLTTHHILTDITELPEGYRLQILPRNFQIEDVPETNDMNATEANAAQANRPKTAPMYKSREALKFGASIVQLLFASSSLYRTRGSQIEQYGYSAYGLSVIPYILMSIINLTANIITPHYPLLYIVRSDVLAEAESRANRKFSFQTAKLVQTHVPGDYYTIQFLEVSDTECYITGQPETDGEIMAGDTAEKGVGKQPSLTNNGNIVTRSTDEQEAERVDQKDLIVETVKEVPEERVGRLSASSEERKGPSVDGSQQLWDGFVLVPKFDRPYTEDDWWTVKVFNPSAILLGFLALVAPYVIIGCLTHFQTGSSTTAQRSWMMSWLVFGQVLGLLVGLQDIKNLESAIAVGFWIVICGAPAIGGLVVVGQMIIASGTCVLAPA